MRYGVPLVFYSLSAKQTIIKVWKHYKQFIILLQNNRKLMRTTHFMNEKKITKV